MRKSPPTKGKKAVSRRQLILTPDDFRKMSDKNKLEDEIQNECVKALKALGFQYLISNAGMRREAAKVLKDKKHGAVFATPGIPDLMIRRPIDSPSHKGWWLGVELKTATGKLSPPQQAIHDKGGSFIARSLDDLIEILHAEFPGYMAITLTNKALSLTNKALSQYALRQQGKAA